MDKDPAVKSQIGAFLLVLAGPAGIFRYIDFNATNVGGELTNRCKIPRQGMWRSAGMSYLLIDAMLIRLTYFQG